MELCEGCLGLLQMIQCVLQLLSFVCSRACQGSGAIKRSAGEKAWGNQPAAATPSCLSPVFEPEAFLCGNRAQCCRVCVGQLLVSLGRELEKLHAKLLLRVGPARCYVKSGCRSQRYPAALRKQRGKSGFAIAASCWWCARRAGLSHT